MKCGGLWKTGLACDMYLFSKCLKAQVREIDQALSSHVTNEDIDPRRLKPAARG